MALTITSDMPQADTPLGVPALYWRVASVTYNVGGPASVVMHGYFSRSLRVAGKGCAKDYTVYIPADVCHQGTAEIYNHIKARLEEWKTATDSAE